MFDGMRVGDWIFPDPQRLKQMSTRSQFVNVPWAVA